MVLLVAGCISGPNGDDGDRSARDVTLIIDFQGFEPHTFPGQRVEWNLGEGEEWTEVKEERPAGAYYIVNDLTASDALDILVAGEAATGVPARSHVESQGAFIDSIDGIVNGRSGHYWSYYINDEYGLVSADKADLSDGDVVRWIYMGNPFG
jgi:hypothetical protein